MSLVGVAGLWGDNPDIHIGTAILDMTGFMRSMAPYETRCWLDDTGNLAMGLNHIASHADRWALVYRGEEMDFNKLNGALECMESDSVKEAASIFADIFVAAVYDKRRKELYLISDESKERPLYYGRTNGIFFFSSESGAVLESGIFDDPACPDIHELPPCTVLVVSGYGEFLSEPEPY
jgi:asparagine synthetase B (glutamine-hydrolysing)